MAEEETIVNAGVSTPPTPTPIGETELGDILSKGTYTDSPTVAENIEGVQPIDTPPAPVLEPTQPSLENIIEPVQQVEGNQPSSTPQPTQPTIYNEQTVNKMIEDAKLEVAKQFEAVKTFMDEYNTDPYKAAAKTMPHLFKDFNMESYVNTKLKEEFGEFVPDANKALMFGTEDFKYKVRQDDLIKEAMNLKSQAYESIQGQQTNNEAQLNTYKATKAKALGMDDSTFQSKIWTQIENMKDYSAIDVIIDAIVAKQKLEDVRSNTQKTIDITKIAPSPSNISGLNSPTPTNGQDLKGIFGE